MDQYKDVPEWVYFDDKQKLEFLGEMEVYDRNEISVFFALCEYAKKYETSYLSLQALYKFIYEYGVAVSNNALKLEDAISVLLKKVYNALRKKNYTAVDMADKKIVAIILQNPSSLSEEEIEKIAQILKNEYADLTKEYLKLFPTNEFLIKYGLSERAVNRVNASEMTEAKIAELEKARPITKIILPTGTTIVSPSDELSRLFTRALEKMKAFIFNSGDFSSMMTVKIKQLFPSLENITRLEDIFKLNEKVYTFWASVTTLVINYIQNNEKYKAIQQSANIVKAISIAQGDLQQKKTHTDKTMEILLEIIKKYPIAFNKNQIMQLREKHSFLKLHSDRDYIDLVNSFLSRYTVPETPDAPPVLVELRVGSAQQYIHRDNFFHNFFEKTDSLSYEIRQSIMNRLESLGANYAKDPLLNNSKALNDFITDYIRNKFPEILSTLENQAVLFSLFVFMGKTDSNIARQRERFFFAASQGVPSLKPFEDIFNVKPHDLLQEAKGLIKIPFFQALMEWFRGLGGNLNKAISESIEEKKQREKEQIAANRRRQAEKAKHQSEKKASEAEKPKGSTPSATPSTTSKIEAAKKDIEKLKADLIGSDSVLETLKKFEGKWNISLSKNVRQENLDYVKSKIQSRLKFMKGFSPEAIKKEVTDMLATEEKLKTIKNQSDLKNFITLYIAETLLQRKSKS